MTLYTERRKHSRFKIRHGSFAGSQPNMGEVIDLSLGGIKFNYLGISNDPEVDCKLFIFSDDGSSIDNIHYKLVSDKVLERKSSFSKIIIRQRRAMFESLTSEQEEQLQYFIIKHKCG